MKANPGMPARPSSFRLAAIALGLAILVGCTPPSRGQGVECIAPANAGGGWDLTCRTVGQVLADLDLVPGLVRTTNMPGAGGGVAFAHTVGRRQGDASVLIAASPATTLRLAQGQYGRLTEEDVRWVGAVGAEYGVVAVAADSPWLTLEQLLDAWRVDPASLVVSGGSAVAGQDHMKVLLLADRAGIDPKKIRYVAFDGGGEAMTALLGGFVQVFSGEASEVESQMEVGALRVLTVLSPERVGGMLAAVPTAREAGYDLEWITWRGFYAPAGIPDSVYDEWVEALRVLGSSAEWEVARQRNRLRPYYQVGPEFEAFVRAQVKDFREMSREIGLIP